MKKTVVVVGVNHAGTSAIRTLLSKSQDFEVVAFDRNTNISFLGCGIALTVGGVVKDVNDLFYANKKALEDMGAKVNMEHDIIEINETEQYVVAKDLQTKKVHKVSYDKLVYAGGSWPIDLGIKNRDLDGIHFCKLFQHAEKLIEEANRKEVKEVAIIGAGYIGIELAEAFQIKGKHVTLIDMQERVLPRYYDLEFTTHLEKNMEADGINMVFGAKTESYIGKDGKVIGVKTSKGDYKADLVIEAIGFKPNTEILPNLDKIRNGAVIVNEKMQTSNKNIYAIGDCIAMYHSSTKTHENIALATNAVKSGIVAACQILGQKEIILPSVVGTNAISVFDSKLASTGLSEEAAKSMGLKVKSSYFIDNDVPEFMEEVQPVAIKLVYEEDTLRLLGAQIGSYGEKNYAEVIYYLALSIQKEMSIIDVAMTDVFFLPHFNKPFNFVISAVLQAAGFDYVNKGE